MKDQIVIEDIDVLVIGGGIAGVLAAIKAKQAGTSKVVLVDKGHVGKSGCAAFGAGILYASQPGVDDVDGQFYSYVRDLGFIGRQDLLKGHFEIAWDTLKEMENLGVGLLRGADGQYQRVEGRGRFPQLMFRGPQMMDALMKAALKVGVEQIHRVMITDLLTHDGQVVGAVGFSSRTGDFYVLKARATILATGPCYYKGHQAAAKDTTGDGYVVAFRAGAILTGAEGSLANSFSARYDIGPGMQMYIGQGGRFLNARGERFMEKYNPRRKERVGLRLLIPFLSVEVRRGNGPIYLDMTHFTPEQVRLLKEVLPLPMKMWAKPGLVSEDKFTRPIEWMPTPCQARLGLLVNERFESSLPGLYSAGEASQNESGGGLLPSATQGVRAGRFAAEHAKDAAPPNVDQDQVRELSEYIFRPLERQEGIEPDQVVLAVLEAIRPYDVLLLRHKQRMERALAEVEDIRESQVPLLRAYDPHYLRMAHEASNIAFVAENHLRSAIFRTESRIMVREDYPYVDNQNWLKWVTIRNENGKTVMGTEDVPIETYPLKVERTKSLAPVWQAAQENGAITIREGEVVWA